MPDKVKDALIKAIPLRRLAQPQEVADAIAFFCRAAHSDYVTGQVLSVSGGLDHGRLNAFFTSSNSNGAKSMKRVQLAGYQARHFGYSSSGRWRPSGSTGPIRREPLTFDSYGELRDLFRRCATPPTSSAIVFTGGAATSAAAATYTRSSARW